MDVREGEMLSIFNNYKYFGSILCLKTTKGI